MKVPEVLKPGDNYDMDELRMFLDAHQVDINSVYEIQFSPNSMLVYQFERGFDGRGVDEGLQLSNGAVVSREPQTIKYRAGLAPEII